MVGDAGSVHVLATRRDGTIRRWVLGAEGWMGPEAIGGGATELAVVRRAQGILDVFSFHGGLSHLTNEGPEWANETRTATNIAGPPTAASLASDRLDVFAVRSDGVPVHWGKKGAHWFDEEVVVEMTFGTTGVVSATKDLKLVRFGPERLNLFARSTAGELVEWTLQAPFGWSGPNVLNGGIRSFDAWSTQDEQVEALTRQDDGTFVHWFFENEPDLSPVAGTWRDSSLVATEPEPTSTTPLPSPVTPDALLVRPPDLVMLGVRWTGFEMQPPAAPGAPAELVAGAAAELTLVFPPQHLAEEVVPADGAAVPGVPIEETGGIPTWRAGLSGASRVVVAVAATEHVVLTAEGVLDAVRRGTLVSSLGVADAKTALEIPFGLVISPHADGADIALAHPVVGAQAGTGAIGLWQTTIAVDGTSPGSPAGLTLRALAARATDPFPVALTRGSRGRIAIESPTARIDRLMLSSIGGTLTATGSWDRFEWEHTAALGRDRRVRTAVEGVLYPFGNRAEYIEVTERVFQSSAEGAVAHLRKATSLRVIEPVRREAPDAPRAAFPFSEVEFERTVFDGVTAEWTPKKFPTPERVQLEGARDQWLFKRGRPSSNAGSTPTTPRSPGSSTPWRSSPQETRRRPTTSSTPEDPESPSRRSAAPDLPQHARQRRTTRRADPRGPRQRRRRRGPRALRAAHADGSAIAGAVPHPARRQARRRARHRAGRLRGGRPARRDVVRAAVRLARRPRRPRAGRRRLPHGGRRRRRRGRCERRPRARRAVVARRRVRGEAAPPRRRAA